MDFSRYIRNVPDFPQPGIQFKDITPLLQDAGAFQMAIDSLADVLINRRPRALVAIESRGFLTGSALAYKLGVPLVIVRKPGKLPYRTVSVRYALEYGSDELHIHEDALRPGDEVVIVDDLLATGGTVAATRDLITKLGATAVEALFLIELVGLKGAERIAPLPYRTLIKAPVDE